MARAEALADPVPARENDEPKDQEVTLTEPATTEPTAQPGGGGRRGFLRFASALLLLALLIPVSHWMHFQATHIVSRNALVRSHLSQLGVRGEGIVETIHVRAGDTVRRGDLLAQLDDRHLQARRAASEAALATLEQRIALESAELRFARRGAEVDLAQATAEYARMRAEAEAARLRAEDARAFHAARDALADDGAISREVIRDAAAKAATAKSMAQAASASAVGTVASLQAAELAIEALALREAELKVLQAQKREAEAELAQVQSDIESMRILAPADGAVVRRLAQPGMAVETGTPILSLWLVDDTWIEAWIPEERLGELAQGSAVQVSFPALPGERFAGTVARIGLATDFEMPQDYLPQTREARMRPTPLVGVEVRISGAPELIRPGLSAVVDIQREGS